MAVHCSSTDVALLSQGGKGDKVSSTAVAIQLVKVPKFFYLTSLVVPNTFACARRVKGVGLLLQGVRVRVVRRARRARRAREAGEQQLHAQRRAHVMVVSVRR